MYPRHFCFVATRKTACDMFVLATFAVPQNTSYTSTRFFISFFKYLFPMSVGMHQVLSHAFHQYCLRGIQTRPLETCGNPANETLNLSGTREVRGCPSLPPTLPPSPTHGHLSCIMSRRLPLSFLAFSWVSPKMALADSFSLLHDRC